MTDGRASARLDAALAAEALSVLGSFALSPADDLPLASGTLLLIGPDEPAFWPHFTASTEYGDGDADPLDRWSCRVIGDIAQQNGLHALYPFGGPPWPPFIGWAQRTGRCFSSPVGMLVHAERGLFFSVRAALVVPWQVEAQAAPRPCGACARPCITACPVSALDTGGYDAPACKDHVTSPQGTACRTKGCAVRRACPVGADLRLPAQSAFHMAAFAPHPEAPA